MIKLNVDSEEIYLKIFKFPAGEISVQIPKFLEFPHNIKIILNWKSNDDLILLALLVDAIKNSPNLRRNDYDIVLDIPYFPYARQDRVCNAGESLSVKVIANFINSLEFDAVYVTDPHSDVVGAVVNNCIIIPIENIRGLNSVLNDNIILVSPDAGAIKKVSKLATRTGLPFIRADKTRDSKTGHLSGTVVYSDDVGDKDFLIVDDISEGGYTFILLAKELEKLTTGKIMLYVTHGIFSKGYDELEKHFDKIYTHNLMGEPNKLVEVI